jgi:tricarballylate dehydrogenase
MLYLTNAQVVDTDCRPIPGLLTGGAMVGGLFHFTHLAGTSLVPGTVFARSVAHV